MLMRQNQSMQVVRPKTLIYAPGKPDPSLYPFNIFLCVCRVCLSIGPAVFSWFPCGPCLGFSVSSLLMLLVNFVVEDSLWKAK